MKISHMFFAMEYSSYVFPPQKFDITCPKNKNCEEMGKIKKYVGAPPDKF